MQFPQDPMVQLQLAIEAVFGSWNNPRAVLYRKQNKIADDLGTAVNVQSMVFGNKGNTSATGVAFTRNPANGEKEFYGDYLVNAQGEDVVAGIRNTSPIAELKDVDGLEEAGRELEEVFVTLENHFRDMCDIEFTIEQGEPGCCRPAWASAPPLPRCTSPSRWRRKASSPRKRPCAASTPSSSTSCCTRSSTRTPPTTWWPAA